MNPLRVARLLRALADEIDPGPAPLAKAPHENDNVVIRGIGLSPAGQHLIREKLRGSILCADDDEGAILASNEVLSGAPKTFVYFVAAGDSVKIGVASHVQTRIAALQCACPMRLDLLLALPGGTRLERALHASFHGRRHGEWFSRTPKLDGFISFCTSLFSAENA